MNLKSTKLLQILNSLKLSKTRCIWLIKRIPRKPIHIFEDLGEEAPISEWVYDKVYDLIRLIFEDIHHLGISHNGQTSKYCYCRYR